MRAQRDEIRSELKWNMKFEGAGGPGMLRWQRDDQIGQVAQKSYSSWGSPMRKTECC